MNQLKITEYDLILQIPTTLSLSNPNNSYLRWESCPSSNDPIKKIHQSPTKQVNLESYQTGCSDKFTINL